MTDAKTEAKVKNENSIEEIEAQILALKSSPKVKTKLVQAEIKRLNSGLNKIYIEYKRKVMDFEKENTSHLVFLRSTNGFYKLLENSLYFYAFDIAPKLNIDAKVYSDGDYELKSEPGITSVKGLDGITKKLATLKIKPVKTKDKTGNVVFFKIPWEYKKEEIEKFKDENSYGMQKYNHVIVATNTIPTLYLNLNEMMKICYENVRRLEPVAREGFGYSILKIESEMLSIYIEMANGRINEVEGMAQLKTKLNQVKAQVKLLVDLKLWNAKTYARVGEVLIKVQRILELRLKGQEKVESEI